MGESEPGHWPLRLPQHPQRRRNRVDVRFDPHNRRMGLCPPERTTQRCKSVPSGGAAVWRHVVRHTGARGYSEMGNRRVDPSEDVAEKDGAKVYTFAFFFLCHN